MPPTPTSEEEYKQWIVLIVCFMIVIAGFALGWFFSTYWIFLSLALFLLLYTWAFHIKWRTQK